MRRVQGVVADTTDPMCPLVQKKSSQYLPKWQTKFRQMTVRYIASLWSAIYFNTWFNICSITAGKMLTLFFEC